MIDVGITFDLALCVWFYWKTFDADWLQLRLLLLACCPNHILWPSLLPNFYAPNRRRQLKSWSSSVSCLWRLLVAHFFSCTSCLPHSHSQSLSVLAASKLIKLSSKIIFPLFFSLLHLNERGRQNAIANFSWRIMNDILTLICCPQKRAGMWCATTSWLAAWLPGRASWQRNYSNYLSERTGRTGR